MANFKNKICKFENCNISFKPNSGGQKYCNSCKIFLCSKEYKSVYNKQYHLDHKDEMNKKSKNYRINNKQKVKIYNKNYSKVYYLKNNIKIKCATNLYSFNNKLKLNKIKNNYENNKRSKDPVYKLRKYTSTAIFNFLKSNNSSKNGESILKYLSYSIEELKIHLESLFEPWMTWDNQGIYKKNKWNDDDKTTWKWQLDHIIPHSTFKYTSMDSEEFRQCWSLENLRPYSAKKNIIDGATKIRHKK